MERKFFEFKINFQESCEILGVNKDSTFEIILNAGNIALPKLLSLKKAMSNSHIAGVWARNELPVSILVLFSLHIYRL